MGLKQSIIIKNEYSVPLPGGKGSRGGTPGSYVGRYMAREGATETLTPIQRRTTDNFIMRYMARESAVEHASSVPSVKAKMRQGQGKGGVAFGYGSLSLSHEQLAAASKDLQRLFENGHTVLKTVLSFDEDYLKKHGIVGEDFHCRQRGDYRGQIDQMKLRMAISHGLERMASGPSGFDRLKYIAVIQVDTKHVHAHLAMADAGPGRRAKDGTQKGKLSSAHRSRLRRGVDTWLDEHQQVAHLSSAVAWERRNVVTYIKRWAHTHIRDESMPQFLLACLPADRSRWRMGSNDATMARPNALMADLVQEQLDRPGSPMPVAMAEVMEYASMRRKNEDLSPAQFRRLVDQGRQRIIERAGNGVYRALAALPPERLNVSTPMISVMSMDYEQMARLAAQRGQDLDGDSDDLITFGFRLRSYSARLADHRRKSASYRDLAQQWEEAEKADVASFHSRPLYDFYRFEADYHDRLVSKYQHFLPFLGDAGQWYQEQEEVADYGRRLLDLVAMRRDATLARMKDEEAAEELGRQIYDQPGGGQLTRGKAGRAVLDQRIRAMDRGYRQRLDDLGERMRDAGFLIRPATPDTDGRIQSGETERRDLPGLPVLSFSEDADERLDGRQVEQIPLEIATGLHHDFDEVKGLDLHHLGYDFPEDVPVDPRIAGRFIDLAARRRELLIGAIEYLERTDQSAAIADLPTSDVAAMSATARELPSSASDSDGVEETYLLPSKVASLRASLPDDQVPVGRTTSLDAGLVEVVTAGIDTGLTEAESPVPQEDSQSAAREGVALS